MTRLPEWISGPRLFAALEWRFVFENGHAVRCSSEADARKLAAGATGRVECRTPWMEPWVLRGTIRNLVGRWLRIRSEHVDDSIGLPDYLVPRNRQAPVFHQLAMDAEHSDLLARLLSGAEPLPFDEWKAGQ